MVKLLVLLLILSIAAVVIAGIAVAVDPRVTELAEPILCPPGWQIETNSSTFRGSTSVSFYCVGDDNQQQDATGRFVLLMFGLVSLPMPISLLLVIAAARRQRRAVQSVFDGTVIPGGGWQTMDAGDSSMKVFGQTITMQGDQVKVESMSPDEVRENLSFNMPFPTAMFQQGDNLTLKEKLQQLTEAYDAGLITRDEFEDRKRQILDRHSSG